LVENPGIYNFQQTLKIYTVLAYMCATKTGLMKMRP